jgi:hypothetical protein
MIFFVILGLFIVSTLAHAFFLATITLALLIFMAWQYCAQPALDN